MTSQNNLNHYWHRGIQEYCNHILHLILVRYKSDSIMFKKSILENLSDAGVSSYMVFELFSEWDILIRMWSADPIANTLVELLEDNNDLAKVQPLRVQRMDHIYDGEPYPSAEDVKETVNQLGLAVLKDVQERGENSEHFSVVKDSRLLLEDTISFDPNSIQFYIAIRSLHRIDAANTNRLLAYLRLPSNIRNKTFYHTAGTAIRLILKGQAADYYDIAEFLSGITDILEYCDISTETFFVANRNVRTKNEINFRLAEEEVFERAFAAFMRELPENVQLPLEDRLRLKALYCSLAGILDEDREGILLNLLRAKATGQVKYIKVTKDFFPKFEDALREYLVQVIRKSYGDGWEARLDELKKSEGVNAAQKKKLTMGDLAKLYRHMIEEHKLISYSPLSAPEFRQLMDELPAMRNSATHTAVNLKDWEALFGFCTRFVPIHCRLFKYFEQLDH